MNLYFAYGSNMDETQMLERCPDAVLCGTAVLSDYRLAFTIYSPARQCGCADVVSSDGSKVLGLLYDLTDKDLARLDVFEGVPTHYRRVEMEVEYEKNTARAFVYEVVQKKKGLVPSVDYMLHLENGARKNNFPQFYLDFLAAQKRDRNRTEQKSPRDGSAK